MRYYDLVQNFDTNQLQTEFANNTYSSGTGFESVSPEPALNNLWLPTISSAQFFSTTQPWNSPGFSSPILNQVNWPYNHNPYNQQWTLDTQLALRSDLLLDIGYVGQHGLREPTYLLFNTATPPKVPGDACNYLFNLSQAIGSNAYCLGRPRLPADRHARTVSQSALHHVRERKYPWQQLQRAANASPAAVCARLHLPGFVYLVPGIR
jgi:hypothetical protein